MFGHIKIYVRSVIDMVLKENFTRYFYELQTTQTLSKVGFKHRHSFERIYIFF